MSRAAPRLPAARVLARSGLVLSCLVVLGACAQPSRPRPSAAAAAACRAETDRVYAAQNRGELSMRDTRDTPFASNYLPGITSRGLGARFGRDNLESSCLRQQANGGGGSAAPGTGPTFEPAKQ